MEEYQPTDYELALALQTAEYEEHTEPETTEGLNPPGVSGGPQTWSAHPSGLSPPAADAAQRQRPQSPSREESLNSSDSEEPHSKERENLPSQARRKLPRRAHATGRDFAPEHSSTSLVKREADPTSLHSSAVLTQKEPPLLALNERVRDSETSGTLQDSGTAGPSSTSAQGLHTGQIPSGQISQSLGMPVLIEASAGSPFAVNIETTDTIGKLKEKIQEHQGIPPDQQRLIFQGKQLEDDFQVAYYNLQKNSIIYLVVRHRTGYQPPKAPAGMNIFVQLPDGKMIELIVELDRTIYDVMTEIESKEGIPMENQSLQYEGKPLISTKTIGDHNIQKESTIRLSVLHKSKVFRKKYITAPKPALSPQFVERQAHCFPKPAQQSTIQPKDEELRRFEKSKEDLNSTLRSLRNMEGRPFFGEDQVNFWQSWRNI